MTHGTSEAFLDTSRTRSIRTGYIHKRKYRWPPMCNTHSLTRSSVNKCLPVPRFESGGSHGCLFWRRSALDPSSYHTVTRGFQRSLYIYITTNMARFAMETILILLVIAVKPLTGGLVPVSQEIVPQGIQSVNGSDIKMGCDNIVENAGKVYCLGDSESLLTDGNSSSVNTSFSNWATDLVTVKKNAATAEINTDYVLLTFGFKKPVSITSLFVDLILCPQWNIGAPYISVYASNNVFFRLVNSLTNADFLANYSPIQTSCDCELSTISLPVQEGEPSYRVWHILVSFIPQTSIQWVHIGEVRFLDIPSVEDNPLPEVFCTPQPLPEPIPVTLVMPTSTVTNTIKSTRHLATLIPSSTVTRSPLDSMVLTTSNALSITPSPTLSTIHSTSSSTVPVISEPPNSPSPPSVATTDSSTTETTTDSTSSTMPESPTTDSTIPMFSDSLSDAPTTTESTTNSTKSTSSELPTGSSTDPYDPVNSDSPNNATTPTEFTTDSTVPVISDSPLESITENISMISESPTTASTPTESTTVESPSETITDSTTHTISDSPNNASTPTDSMTDSPTSVISESPLETITDSTIPMMSESPSNDTELATDSTMISESQLETTTDSTTPTMSDSPTNASTPTDMTTDSTMPVSTESPTETATDSTHPMTTDSPSNASTPTESTTDSNNTMLSESPTESTTASIAHTISDSPNNASTPTESSTDSNMPVISELPLETTTNSISPKMSDSPNNASTPTDPTTDSTMPVISESTLETTTDSTMSDSPITTFTQMDMITDSTMPAISKLPTESTADSTSPMISNSPSDDSTTTDSTIPVFSESPNNASTPTESTTDSTMPVIPESPLETTANSITPTMSDSPTNASTPMDTTTNSTMPVVSDSPTESPTDSPSPMISTSTDLATDTTKHMTSESTNSTTESTVESTSTSNELATDSTMLTSTESISTSTESTTESIVSEMPIDSTTDSVILESPSNASTPMTSTTDSTIPTFSESPSSIIDIPANTTPGTLELPTSSTSTPIESTMNFTEPIESTTDFTEPMIIDPPDDGIDTLTDPTENNGLPYLIIVLVAGIIGFVLLALFSVIIIGFISYRRHNKKQVWYTENRYSDIPFDEDGNYCGHLPLDITPSTNNSRGQRLAATNPNVFSSIVPDMDIETASLRASGNGSTEAVVVDGETLHSVHCPTSKAAEASTNAVVEREVEAMLSIIARDPPLTPDSAAATTTTESPAYMCLDEEKQSFSLLVSAETANSSEVEDEEESSEAEHIYSDVQHVMGPVVPPKSTDLVQYLDVCSAFNAGVHSESLNWSDFTHEAEEEEEEGDAQVYAPIYPPTPTVLPEGCQQPAEMACDKINEIKKLGVGQFGEVILASTNGLSLKDMQLSTTDNDQNISILVTVKRRKTCPSQTQQELFDTELKFMSEVTHPNVVRLLGVCSNDPAFIMMEYMEEDDLCQYLKKYSEIVPINTPSNNTQIATASLVYMASQIASAMQYLTERNFVHQDLATRNCFVGKDFAIKISNLGMNEAPYKAHYYHTRGNKLLPIRWMATESFNGKFSEKSDVWAFGVTMWELFTLAKNVPYPHLSNREVIHDALKRESRQLPSRPASCPESAYAIMQQCWVIDFQQRATFQELNVMLQTCI